MSGHKFKVGDSVICIDPDPYNSSLTKGRVYKVKEVWSTVVRVVCDTGSVQGFLPDRFKKVEDTMNEIVTLNGVTYRVENIPGKGECLVPVKRKPVVGEVWAGPQGGVYIITASDETQGFELRSKMVYPIPPSAQYVAPSLTVWINNGGNL